MRCAATVARWPIFKFVTITRIQGGRFPMKVCKWSGPALQEGAAALIRQIPTLKGDMPRAIAIAEAIASAMVMEDQGRKYLVTLKE